MKAPRVYRISGALALCGALFGCAASRDWQAPAAATPDSLASTRALAAAAVDASAWPTGRAPHLH